MYNYKDKVLQKVAEIRKAEELKNEQERRRQQEEKKLLEDAYSDLLDRLDTLEGLNVHEEYADLYEIKVVPSPDLNMVKIVVPAYTDAKGEDKYDTLIAIWLEVGPKSGKTPNGECYICCDGSKEIGYKMTGQYVRHYQTSNLELLMDEICSELAKIISVSIPSCSV